MATRVVLIGATGSIGRQALDVISRFPDEFELVGAVAGRRSDALELALRPFPDVARVLVDPSGPVPSGTGVGVEAACELASLPGADVVLVGGGGAGALLPTLAACEAGRVIAVASKEVLVMAGALVTAAARRHGAQLVPVDSEHSAIWQCLRGEDPASVDRLILTASGGPFRTAVLAEIRNATVELALAHPNWKMGPKVTIDSATMMNKGLEVIEAHFLFQIPYDRIEVVIHSQSVVHSAVQFCDGTMVAQLGLPDMRAPIALAMSGGRRLPGVVGPLRLTETLPMEFSEVEPARFPALGIARGAALAGGAVPAAMNAANEVAVAAFLEGRLHFGEISEVVGAAVQAFARPETLDLAAILAADGWARRWTAERIAARAGEMEPARGPA